MTREPNSNRQIAPRVLSGVARSALRRPPGLRMGLLRDTWSTLKSYGSPIRSIEVDDIACIRDTIATGYIDDPNRLILSALCSGLRARRFFEIGTNRGRTAWSVAANNPELELWTLDLPSQEGINHVALDVNDSDRDFFLQEWDRGEAFDGTPESQRITQLWGDSATFDFAEFAASMDVVFVDGAHSYPYVRNDSDRALEMLGEGGAVVWDDYPGIPGVYACLTELATSLDVKPFHIRGTRLVVYSRKPLIQDAVGHLRRRQFAA